MMIMMDDEFKFKFNFKELVYFVFISHKTIKVNGDVDAIKEPKACN